MQNLFDKASLVMVPSGYGNGKLYNIKPEDKGSAFEFERATMATRVNSSGLVETMFPEATNLLLQSNNFDTSPWASISSNETGGQVGYDGTNDAWEVTTTSSTGSLYQLNTDSGVQTFSVYAKSDGSTGLRMYAFGNTNANAYFNLSTGAVVTSSNTITSNIENVGGGWYKCSITFNQTNTVLRFYTTNNSTTPIAGTIYIQDAQLETGYFATPYIETSTQTVTRQNQANQPRIDYSSGEGALLLEPARTNLITYSEDLEKAFAELLVDSIIVNYGTSPEGVVNSTRLEGVDLTGGQYFENFGSSLTDGTEYTFSCYYKGTLGEKTVMKAIGVDGSGTSVEKLITFTGNWQRENITFTAGSTSNYAYITDQRVSGTTASNFEVWGAQLEQGSYPASYIPTNGQAETRSKDLCQLSAGGVNETEGTFFIDYGDSPNVNALFASSTSNNTITNNIRLSKDQLYIRNGGGNLIVANLTAPDSGKLALTYSTSGVKIFANGGSTPIYTSTTSITFDGPIDYVRVGSRVNDVGVEEFKPKQFLIFPEVLTDEELQRLTSPSADATTFTELANNNGYTIL